MNIQNPPIFDHIVGALGNTFRPLTIQIGSWNINAVLYKEVSWGTTIDPSKVVLANIIIIEDGETQCFSFGRQTFPLDPWPGFDAGVVWIYDTGGMVAAQAGSLSSSAFSDPNINRGYVTLWLRE